MTSESTSAALEPERATTAAAPNDGAPNDGAPNDGALNDGALNDGALNDGALNDGALNDGALIDGDALTLDAAGVEALVGYVFKDPALLSAALTHPSFRNESHAPIADYQRLEFLGDAVAELVVSTMLFERFSGASEGRLTQLRASLVSARSLAKVARRLGLGSAIRMGRGELKGGGRDRTSFLADAVEAVAGAVYLDGGFGAASAVLRGLLAEPFGALSVDSQVRDAKSLLQEWSQDGFQQVPLYRVVEMTGPQHDASFTVVASVAGVEQEHVGTGRTKQEAEQAAAQGLLNILNSSTDTTATADVLVEKESGDGR